MKYCNSNIKLSSDSPIMNVELRITKYAMKIFDIGYLTFIIQNYHPQSFTHSIIHSLTTHANLGPFQAKL